MPSFQQMFIAAKGKPIRYNGHELVMADRMPLLGARKIKVSFESTSSKYRQGIGVDMEKACETRVNGQVVAKKEWNVLWEDTASKSVEIELLGPAEHVAVFNMWQDPNRVMIPGVTGSGQVNHYWQNGAAMIVEEIPNGRRYRCNDGEPDDDFDDLVFTVERVTE